MRIRNWISLMLAGVVALAISSSASANHGATVDFESLAEGSIVTNLTFGNGISGIDYGISIAVASNPANSAMIFDGTCQPGGTPADCTGEDPDLFAPAQANLLIVSEDGDTTDPDDRIGGTLTFDFSAPVTVEELFVIDTEEGGSVELYDAGAALIGAPIALPIVADGASQVVSLGDTAGVSTLVVILNGSGAIDDLDFFMPGGGEGCTPGYWKNHTDVWPVGYEPGDSFDDTFGVVSTGDPTLLQALNAGGGDESALQRHAVAALLNAASPEVDSGLTEAEVIAIVQAAYASGEFEDAKDELAVLNELGCPLGGTPATGSAPGPQGPQGPQGPPALQGTSLHAAAELPEAAQNRPGNRP